ncbi:hypothetical protein FHX37_2822 [Haloactinospora alba]|uniref:TPR repeat protein n=1 Tax=Haloactinospora alba TaxID=405555 RepID=A0A543NM05_9ACTN|nr:tetratricopeptide/SEL1-like repeat protein [Haloactinospora alba]TQN32837.1 hypothetical protein FHX37_2822 [Haloactinospora alba]
MAHQPTGNGGTHNEMGDVWGTGIQIHDVYGNVTLHTSSPGWSPPPRDSWPRITEADPYTLGVHRARPGSEKSDLLPPYVPRDMDTELHRRIRHARDNGGGFILITGDSTAGKTRTALEALRTELPTWPVLIPPRNAELTNLASNDSEGGYVLWLDDAEAHLGPQSLDPTLVDHLTRTGVVVMATMRQQFYDTFKNTPTAANEERHDRMERDIGMRVLTMAEQVELERVWSTEEIDRTEDFEDARLAEAHRHHGIYGIAEYLAAGPQLLEEWTSAYRATAQGGHPRGYALVAAAVDLAWAGMTSPVPGHVLEKLHTCYLTNAAPLRPEPLADAWQWATRQRHGVTSLLLPGDLEETTWRPFDYLVDHPHEEEIPARVWEAALEHALTQDDRFTVGVAAYQAGISEIAEAAWQRSAHDGVVEAMYNLGLLLYSQGRLTKAEGWWTTAARTGRIEAMVNLGILLYSQGRLTKAEHWYTTAARTGDVEAMYNLGILLYSQRRFLEAEHWWTTAARTGHTDAVVNLGVLCEYQKRFDEAEHWYTTAAQKDHTSALVYLGTLIYGQGRLIEAEGWWTTAAHAGDTNAMNNLGVLCEYQKRFDEAEHWHTAAAQKDHTSSMVNLGTLIARQGRFEEAKHWWITGAHAGESIAMNNLGLLFNHHEKRVEEAERWWRLAADQGHKDAKRNLAKLRRGQKRNGQSPSQGRKTTYLGRVIRGLFRGK